MKNSKLNRSRRAIAVLAVAFIVLICAALPVFAANEAEEALNKTNDLIFGIVRTIGIGMCGWAIFEIGKSLHSHDGASRVVAMGTLAGGLVMVFAKQLLSLIGAI